MRRSVWNARASNGEGSVPLRADIKGTELPPANILIPLERQLTALQLRDSASFEPFHAKFRVKVLTC